MALLRNGKSFIWSIVKHVRLHWNFWRWNYYRIYESYRNKNEMLWDVGDGGLVSVLDVQSLFFFIKENWILAMTRHHANNILTRDLHFDSDVRQWSHLLMILLHGLWTKSNVTWICFCLHFVHSHARCGCFILFYP